MVFSSKHLMKLFSPLQLRQLLVLHNIICCLASIAAISFFVPSIWLNGSVFETKPDLPYLKTGLFIYWITKYYELFDTVFMLLRHKRRQMSFLHVFHHASMAFLSDYSYNYAPVVSIGFGLCLNSVVHVVMYGYYAITAFYPLQEFTWKKRITQLQMIQFTIGVAQCTYGYLYHNICIYSIFYVSTLLLLFSKFYYDAFIVKRSIKKR